MPSIFHRTRSASLPASREPISAARPRTRAPCGGAEPERLTGVQGGLAVRAEPVDEERVAQLGVQLARLVGRGAVDAETDGDAGLEHVRDAGDAGRQTRVGRRAVRDTRARTGEGRDVRVVHVDAVRHPHVLTEPARRLEVVGRAHAEELVAELLLLDRLAAVGVQPYPEPTRQLGALLHEFGGHGERRTGGDGHLGHRAEGGVMVLVDGLLGGRERTLEGLDREVRRQAAVLLGAVHGATGEREADTHVGGGPDDGAGQVAGALRVHVVVVHRGGHTAAGHHREGALRGDAGHLLVDACPRRVQRDQPVEQVVVRGQAAGDPLVEVVVRVDQTGRDEVAGAVDAAHDVLQARGGLVGADGLDLVVGDDHVPRGVLGVVGVDRRDGRVLDDDAGRGCRRCHGASFMSEWRLGTAGP